MLFGMIRPATIVHARSAIVWLRICSSLAWIQSAFIGKDAKVAPNFLSGSGLAERIQTTFVHTALDTRIAHLLVTFVAPHAAVFAALIALADVTIAVSLGLGLLTRVGASIALLRTIVNVLVAGGAGADTIGYNAMLAVTAALCAYTAAGRRFGIDGDLIDRYPKLRLLRVFA